MTELAQRSHVIKRENVSIFAFLFIVFLISLQRPEQVEIERRAIASQVSPEVGSEMHNRSRGAAKIGVNLYDARI